MLSGNPVNNFVLSITEPFFVLFNELYLRFSISVVTWPPHVPLVLSILEEATIMAPKEAGELSNMNLFDICRCNTIWHFNLSELFTMLITLDATSHSVNRTIGSNVGKVIGCSENLHRADRCCLHHQFVFVRGRCELFEFFSL